MKELHLAPPHVVRPAEDLALLAGRIKGREERAGQDLLEHARRQGQDLIKARQQCGPRKFAPWLREHFDFSRQTAYGYIRVAENWGAICKAGLPMTVTQALRTLSA